MFASRHLPGTFTLALGLALALPAHAAPSAHLLRVDPRTSVEDGNPVVTTLIDLTETRRISELLGACAGSSGDAALDCTSDALEKPGALASRVPFPEKQVLFSVRIGDADVATRYLGHTRWGETQSEPGVGTAWLVIVDADDHTGKVLDEFVAVARRFVEAMGPNDLVNLIVLSDRQIAVDSRWLSTKANQTALEALAGVKETYPSKGRTRPLYGLIKQATTDAFRALGSSSEGASVPLHQAVVILSSGYGGGDPSTTAPGAEQMRAAFTEGRLGDGNAALPKTPVPIVSILTPPTGLEENRQLAREFMQTLANPEIGGFFSVIRDGQANHAARVVDAVRARFADMIVARFKVSCLAPSTTQSFSLLFPGHSPAIVGDATFQNVPLGFDPSVWPLDVDVEMTRQKAADSGGIHPGGAVKIYGNFCWEGDVTRPEAYFLPPGETLPKDLAEESPDAARQVQKRLIGLDLRGTAVAANESFAEFRIPDSDSILHGEGDSAVIRLVVVDRVLKRTSGLSESTVLQLKARSHPLPVLPLALGGGVLLASLIGLGIFLKKSNKDRTRTSTPPGARVDGSPYATPSPVTRTPRGATPLRATLEGDAGRFVILPGADLRVGRDGARCAAVLTHPQISGLHATFRIEDGRVLVRDEGSTSGTRVMGRLLEAGRFVPLETNSEISLGPESFRIVIGES